MSAAEENLTVKETARILRRTPKTLYGWIRAGVVFNQVTRVRDGYLIPAAELKRILSDGLIELNEKPENGKMHGDARTRRRIIDAGIKQ
jgi:Helix-turn-helix domain